MLLCREEDSQFYEVIAASLVKQMIRKEQLEGEVMVHLTKSSMIHGSKHLIVLPEFLTIYLAFPIGSLNKYSIVSKQMEAFREGEFTEIFARFSGG